MDVKTLQLAGTYGDIFWSLDPAIVHLEGAEIPVHIYVVNNTDTEHEYMMQIVLTRGVLTLSEIPIPVDEKAWFTVEAGDIISYVGSLKIAYTDVVMSLNLYERTSNAITDSISTTLIKSSQLPTLPSTPIDTSDLFSGLINIMLVIMIMGMMVKMFKDDKKQIK